MNYKFHLHAVVACLLLNAYSVVFAGQTAPIWIDVRTPAEYASGHVNGAVNIEFQTIAERIADVTNDKNADIRLYCRSGRRSGVAKEALVKLGYENVSNEGGYAAALVAFEKQNQKP